VTTEPTGFLYPFIDADEHDAPTLIADLAASAAAKMALSAELRTATVERYELLLQECGMAMAERFRNGGRLFAFGNGGSSTDAESAVALFRSPPLGAHALPALSLVDDRAVITALANDVGFELIFSRQLIAHAQPGDIAIGFSTSGDSVNVLQAFGEAASRRLLTVGLCGYDGGRMASTGDIDHCFVVASDSVHRIQETQAALVLRLWSVVQDCLKRVSST